MMTNADLLTAGREWQQAGNLSRAEGAFRELVSVEPENTEAWQALGSVCRAQGKRGDAVDAFQRAVTHDPQSVQAHNSLGIALLEAGNIEGAAACFERVLELNPGLAAVYNNLGNVYLAQGRKDDALRQYEHAVRLQPEFAEAHGNLGNVLRELGRHEQALASCRLGVQLKPDFTIGHNSLGAVYSALRRWDEAGKSFREALRLNPNYPEAHTNLGAVLRELGRLTEAEAELREALRLRPEMIEAHIALARVQLDANRLEAAEASCREALRLRPNLSEALQALGMIDMLLARPEQALDWYRQAVALDPNEPSLHRNVAIALLLMGRYAEGWAEYEWRWRCPEAGERPSPQPLWDGSSLEGRTIVLYGEQGLGDTVQFVRYARLARERGGRVVVAAQNSILPLLRSADGVDDVVALGDPLLFFDVHAGLIDVARIVGTTEKTIPADVPYIEVEAQLVEHWRQELASLGGFKVGIAWQGKPSFYFDRFRSMPLKEFAPLAAVPGITLISLQKGFGSEQIAALDGLFKVVDLGPQLDERAAFLDTAAVIKNLDLVIASDSATAHLAGALGVPVWLATPFSPDWRWLLARDDSPWYPTMRLFRQERRGDWRHVFQRMAMALAERVGAPPPPPAITVEIAPGELIDKITILEIKAQRIVDEAKLRNVRTELAVLVAARDDALPRTAALDELTSELRQVNEALWEIEDAIRLEEREQSFGDRFIELARSVYRENDRRAALKWRINELVGSRLIEEKNYAG
jgi:tetratricopeptide (TPR) repeat protein